MAEPHHPHHDPIEDNIETHPAKLAISIVVGAVALIIGIILLTQLASNYYGSRDRKGEPSMSDKAVAARLAPVAQVAIDPNAPATPAPVQQAPMPAAPGGGAAPAKTADAGNPGKSTYDSVCTACHGSGVAGAPKFGDKGAWGPRIAKGKDVLYEHALKGLLGKADVMTAN